MSLLLFLNERMPLMNFLRHMSCLARGDEVRGWPCASGGSGREAEPRRKWRRPARRRAAEAKVRHVERGVSVCLARDQNRASPSCSSFLHCTSLQTSSVRLAPTPKSSYSAYTAPTPHRSIFLRAPSSNSRHGGCRRGLATSSHVRTEQDSRVPQRRR